MLVNDRNSFMQTYLNYLNTKAILCLKGLWPTRGNALVEKKETFGHVSESYGVKITLDIQLIQHGNRNSFNLSA